MKITEASPDALTSLLAERATFVAYVEKRLRGTASAEEIVQDAFAKALVHRDELHAARSARAWFFGILRNAVVDAKRRADVAGRAHERLVAEAPALSMPEPTGASCRCIGAVVSGLKEEYREVLTHVVAEDEPLATFASRSGLTNNHAAVRVHRAKKALAATVKKTCGACASAGCRDCTCARPPGA